MPDNIVSLVDRHPTLDAAEIVASLVPPLHFHSASFESYVPDADYPSQDSTRVRLAEFAAGTSVTVRHARLFSRAKKGASELPGVYLDGGFGVGKTHLLAAAWNVAGGRKYFGTFLQYTSLVGALGYVKAVDALRGASLICIDEFELDDPGDTMMMTRMLGELMAAGTKVAATSNTPPQALGEGRFAAADFLREIHALAATFETIRIDGTDYRRRTSEGIASVYTSNDLSAKVSASVAGGTWVAYNSFDDVLKHLGSIHPSTYLRLINGIDVLALQDVHVIMNQTDALRLVAFIDRVYDAQIPIWASGTAMSDVFGGDMINGGYRKKYLRCVSRLIALTNA
ncbi:cell division protein ZapE [Alpinimonas psychrophila]|uniref:Cell division protein ZapE n=1 Tax=Alpinimonas psychrophila TaxID=748908 RepID=A0A7W3JST5_9MICO|nr:cell division protein ZapE [Alpinimonas psychrophila]